MEPPKLVPRQSLCASRLVHSMPKVLSQNPKESTDSDDLFLCNSPDSSSLIDDVCDDDDDDGLPTTKHQNDEDIHESGVEVGPTHQVTQSLSKQFQNLCGTPTMID